MLRNLALACLLALAVALGLAACSPTGSTAYTAPGCCYSDGVLTGDSLILKALPDPRLVKTTIVTAVTAGLAAGKINAAEVRSVAGVVRLLANSGVMYADLAGEIAKRVNSSEIKAVLTIVKSSGMLDSMAMDYSVISACDKALLVKLCDAVLEVLAAYTA